MAEVEVLLRGGTVGIAALMAILLGRARPPRAVAATGVLLLAGAAAYALWGLPASRNWPAACRVLIVTLSVSAPFFFWLFVRAVFEEGVRLRAAHLLWLPPMEACGIAALLTRGAVAPETTHLLTLGFRLPSLVLIGHALWCLWRERTDDLVERRRALRLGILAGAALLAVMIVVAALTVSPAPDRGPMMRLLESALLFALLISAGSAFAELHRDLVPDTPPPRAMPAPGPLPDEDGAALTRLDHLMRADTVWRDAGLTVGGLAARVGVPEYRLRRLINGRLGYRNFAAFLNEHRLAAACERLSDPAAARTPVLTIALDLGYGSIGPFNRAFRARFGRTPTEFRRTRLGAPPG